jgi:uncharacterized protein YbjT (DUF2867 family)
MAGKTVWMAGATGLVGRETLRALLAEPGFVRIVVWTRRPSGQSDPRLDERIVDFEQLEAAFAHSLTDAAVCCLGTTIKTAGSKERFRRVDYEYVLAFARAAKRAGAKHFVVVTALGANPRSALFYNRVKGELEQALAALPFASLSIVRPSLLLGERGELRVGERLFQPLSRILPRRYRGIEARTVARAIVKLLHEPGQGRRVVPSDELQTLGA